MKIVLLTILAIISISAVNYASAVDYNVNPGNATNIKDIINSQPFGSANFFLEAGNYSDTIIIPNGPQGGSVTIQGITGREAILESGISFQNIETIEGVTLKNLTIHGPANNTNYILDMISSSITNFEMDNVLMDGQNFADLTNYDKGLHGAQPNLLSDNLTIINSEFTNILGWSVFDTGEGGDSVNRFDVINFTNNYVHDNDGTIELGNSNYNQRATQIFIKHNVIENIGDNFPTKNDKGCTQQWAGIDIGNAEYALVLNNTINNVKPNVYPCLSSVNGDGEAGVGLYIWGIEEAHIKENIIADNNYGISWTNNHHHGSVNLSLTGTILIDNVIYNNTKAGFSYFAYNDTSKHYYTPSLPIEYLGDANFDNNYWGDKTGPYIVDRNENGLGNAVTGFIDTDSGIEYWYVDKELTKLNLEETNTGEFTTGENNFVGQLGSGFESGEIVLRNIDKIVFDDDTGLDLVAGITEIDEDINDFGSIINLNKTVTTATSNDIVLQSVNSAAYTVTIPDDVTVKGEYEWDGIIYPPTPITATGTIPSGLTLTTVIEVGSPLSVLILDDPAEIILAGVTGSVGYKLSGETEWIEITETCGGTYDIPDYPVEPLECFISDGTNTKIVTWHFSGFGGGSPSSSPSTTKSGGGSSGDQIPPKFVKASAYSSSILSHTLSEKMEQPLTFQTGEPITFEVEFYENGGRNIPHFELVTGISGHDGYYDSDLWVEYNLNSDLIIKDKENLWSSSDITVVHDGTTSIVKFTITFEQPMEISHVIIKAWDDNRNSMSIEFNNSLHIVQAEPKPTIPSEIADTTSTEKFTNKDGHTTHSHKEYTVITDVETGATKLVPTDELVTTSTPINETREIGGLQTGSLMQSIDKWAGYSSTSLTDKEFLNSIGVDGHHIPKWIKENTVKWVRAGDITTDEFVAIFEELEKRKILD